MDRFRLLSFLARSRTRCSLLLAALVPLAFSAPGLAAGPTLEWIRQFGTAEHDDVAGLSLDGAGNTYLSAVGSLNKFDAFGNKLWTAVDSGIGAVFADALGNVFATRDGIDLRNLDVDGNVRWRRPAAGNVSADGLGNVYLGSKSEGSLGGGLITKFDAAGNELSRMQFEIDGVASGMSDVRVSADALGNIFASGYAWWGSSTSQRPRGFLTRLDSDGNQEWTRLIISGRYVFNNGMATDGLGNVYIAGSSSAPLTDRGYEGYDPFLAKYDAHGNRLWIREFGSSGSAESADGVSVDGLGNVFVTGGTGGGHGGASMGRSEPFLAKFNTDGEQLWFHQFGTSEYDSAPFISANGLGYIYIAGITGGGLGGPHLGGSDVFLAKFRDDTAVPEPASLLLLTIAALACWALHRKRRDAVRFSWPWQIHSRRDLKNQINFATLAASLATRASSTAVRFIVPAAMCLATVGSPFTSAAEAVTIDMVHVGNPGNAADTRYNAIGFGSVGYNYQIGKYEVTAGQYTEFLNAVAESDPNGLYDTAMGNPGDFSYGANIQRSGSSPNFSYSVAADWANRPVNYVSFWDAARFANWLHNGQPNGAQGPATTEAGAYHEIGDQALFGRNPGAKFFIPTEDEWYKAAYHDKTAGLAASYFDRPMGTNAFPGQDRTETTNAGNNANFNNFVNGPPYYRTEVGDFELSDSPYGTFDQGGNVFEWNETSFFSSSRGMRGGAYDFDVSPLHARSRSDSNPDFGGQQIGFRIAAIPEPSTLLLAIMAGARLFLRRRR